jgi:hypothetical protein
MSAAKRTDSDCFARSGRYPVERAHRAGSGQGGGGHPRSATERGQLSPYAGLRPDDLSTVWIHAAVVGGRSNGEAGRPEGCVSSVLYLPIGALGHGRSFQISSIGMRAENDQVSIGVAANESSSVGPVGILVANQSESGFTQARGGRLELVL